MATAASRWQPPRPLPPPPGRGVAARDPREGAGGARWPDPGRGVRPPGSTGPGGRPFAPCPPPPGGPGIGSEKGRRDPAPRPPPPGWRLYWKGGGIRGGGDALAFPHPKHGRCPPPAGGGSDFRIGGAQPERPAERALPRPHPGDHNPQLWLLKR